MKEYFRTDLGVLYQGNCIEIMKSLPDNSVDTIITDPPYGLAFMNKEWDKIDNFQQFTYKWAKEALRVAKPGATLLVFGGTRMWHRMACGLEDAGWIIKDTLMWLYGSGFPKATDEASQIEHKLTGKSFDEIRENGLTTLEAKLWAGWKSHGLKPAYEPIIMAMKPNEGSYAENALKWGVAGLNIDAGRIRTEVRFNSPAKARRGTSNASPGSGINYKGREVKGRYPANILLSEEAAKMLDEQSGVSESNPKPRNRKAKGVWHNLLSNNPIEYSDKGGASRFFYVAKASKKERNMGCEELEEKPLAYSNQAQAELKRGNINFDGKSQHYNKIKHLKNIHPTVKPLKLIQYLVKLTSMPSSEQIYLDPFLGSGTTAMACESLSKHWIGIEKNHEYCEISKRRILAVPKKLF